MKLTLVVPLIAAASLAAAGPGCGSDSEPINCNFTGAASAVVGGGTDSTGFLNLNDGDEMTVSLGPQGAWMVTPSIRVQNMWPGKSGRTGNSNDPEVVTELYLDGNLVGGSAREYLGLTPAVGGGAEALGMFSPFVRELELVDYLGRTVRIRGVVEDACGRRASDELDVVVRQ